MSTPGLIALLFKRVYVAKERDATFAPDAPAGFPVVRRKLLSQRPCAAVLRGAASHTVLTSTLAPAAGPACEDEAIRS